ncbi:hypothetical protein ABT369_28390 [Dactylosporangium sp. NPDC000244]|uniref:hypothetical protein n=1 Tax=Dactylosporangium sp. NPDC000244 TaxID=3154365 RepID=UPI0033343E24
MIRRLCACGTPIVRADLDGYDIWLDQGRDGWISIDQHGRAEIGTGPWRRHTCAHDPRPLDLDAPPTRDAVGRDVAAARAVLNAGRALTGIQEKAARHRVANPHLSGRQVARNAGLSNYVFHVAFQRIREYAKQITTQGDAA